MIKQSRSIVIGLMVTALLLAGGAYWFFKSFESSPIKPYDAARDKAFIIKTFKDNWYWLLSDYSPDYNVAFMLDHRSPTAKDMSDAGKLILKTYVLEGKPVGFIHYYEDELKIGQILFLGVAQEYRGKGLSREMMKYALRDLKSRGMLVIRLNTRTDNTKARKLYESLGFTKIWTDGAYVIYELIP